MINECRERVRITITKFCLIGYDGFLIAQNKLQYIIRDTKVIVKKKKIKRIQYAERRTL